MVVVLTAYYGGVVNIHQLVADNLAAKNNII
jgi:hypothetical protein